MILLDGKKLSEKILENIKKELEKSTCKPTLAVVLVGQDSASKIYVKNKNECAEKLGINSICLKLPDTISEDELCIKVKELSDRKDITAILVQLPLPKHINPNKVIDQISPNKDVDGFHPYNLGCLLSGIKSFAVPCTPKGIIRLLKEYNIKLEGKNVVVIGRSNIVGKPTAQLFLQENSTVTICHSRTKNLPEITKRADIIVVAVGKSKFITSEYIKENAIVIDVGISRNEQGRLSGDVDFENVKNKVQYITPVPGGIGPMTIAMLMENTIELFKQK